MSPRALLLLVAGCLTLQPISTDLYLASLPHLAAEFAVSPAVVQQTLSLFAIGFGLAQLISGPLSDRYGRRPVLLGGLATYVAASVGCALAGSMPALIAGRFIQAVGCCTAVVVARAIIRDAYPPTEGVQAIARASTLMAIAIVAGPIAGGYLQAGAGWRAAFWLHGGIGIAVALAVAWRLRETIPQRDPAAIAPAGLARNFSAVMGTSAFWAYALPGSLSYGSIFVFISGASFALIGVLGVSAEFYGYCFAFGCVGFLGGTVLCRRLLGGIGPERVMGLGAALSLAAGLIFLALVAAGLRHWGVVVLGQFLAMFAHGLNFPCTQAGSVAPFPRLAGSAAALFGLFIMVAALLVGSWVGASHDGTLYPLAISAAVMGSLVFLSVRVLAPARLAAAGR